MKIIINVNLKKALKLFKLYNYINIAFQLFEM